uniref:IQ motif containing with AAA domain 1 n=1 Tax=Astyanax mexicanus TaxID=7994 RepID=A0A8B9L3X0_ASTMX
DSDVFSYSRIWAEAQGALADLLEDEIPPTSLRPQKDRFQAFHTLATFYLRYLHIFRRLEEVYDQIVHPQKRQVVRQVLEGVMGRLVELKNEMVELEFSEFHYLDDLLQDLKMTPEDLDVPIPRYFIRERMKALKERERMLAHILDKKGSLNQEPVSLQVMSVERAVQLLQVSERARQGRLRAHFMKEIWREERRIRQGEDVFVFFLLYCRDATGKFPDFPSAEDGGSASIFSQKSPEEVAAELAAKQQEKEKKKSKGKKDKNASKERKEKKKDKKGKSKGKGGKSDIEEEEKGWKMSPSNFLPTVAEGAKLYRGELAEGCTSLEFSLTLTVKTLCLQVDELMRQELKNLKLTVDREKGKKKKKTKKANKKVKDLHVCPPSGQQERETIESLYEELVLEGILTRPHNVKLSEYLGEYSYLGTSLRQANIEPMPSLSDVRQLIALYGVLPLGSQSVHERGPLIRSLLLAGPSGVGKKMLLHALCTETGANLFNLSPGNLAGKYPGKSGLQYLLHMVLKVARQLQPSVLWIGDAEKTFYKKVPKAEKELEPKRLKKDLVKVVKSIKVEDRVLLVGTSRRPFDADLKSLSKVYKKIILIPRPDYSSRLSEYKTFMNLIISIFKKVTFFLFLSIYTPKSRVTHKPI